ncbi:MAG: ABA4-like family protein [Hyphomicrobiales bacterium]|nr:ABA4-like family protein [Hyphomicrobiales bacterium]
MTPEQAFQISSGVPLLGWAALLFLPGSKIALEGVARILVPGVLALAYAAIIGRSFVEGPGLDFSAFMTLDGIRALGSDPWLALAGWLHYLAFDLLVGCWEVRTARDEGIPHAAVIPCLLLTFMLGPVGFLAFLMVRALFRQRSAH